MIWLLTILFTLLPLYLIRFQIGPIPTTVLEILVGITIIAWVYIKIKNRDYSLVKNIPNRNLFLSGAGLFLVGATIGIFISPNFRAALGEWKAFYFEPIIIGLIVIDCIKSKEDVKKILGGLLLGSLTTAILGVYQHFTGWLVPHSFWANRNTYRVTGWYGFPNSVGILLAPLIPLAVYVAIETLKKSKNKITSKNNYFILFLLGLFLIASPLAIIFAKTTAAMVGLAAGVGILLLCFKKTRLPAIMLGIIGLIGLFIMPNNAITNELLAKDYSGQLRRDIWSETITYLKLHPLVGTGVAGYTTEIAPLRHNKKIEVFHHPHNIFLTIWVNTGLIGLAGFIALLTWFYITVIKNLTSPNHAFAITLLVSMTIWLTMGLVDSPYIKNDWALIFWLFIALTAVLPRLHKKA
ncbi:MAG: O-antigen ligase family protein [Candidatus Magasanikbacteria bacterium]|nr:O-antigen ligase family protein [Candidatus Magasanikbacteria bacterium]